MTYLVSDKICVRQIFKKQDAVYGSVSVKIVNFLGKNSPGTLPGLFF